MEDVGERGVKQCPPGDPIPADPIPPGECMLPAECKVGDCRGPASNFRARKKELQRVHTSAGSPFFSHLEIIAKFPIFFPTSCFSTKRNVKLTFFSKRQKQVFFVFLSARCLLCCIQFAAK